MTANLASPITLNVNLATATTTETIRGNGKHKSITSSTRSHGMASHSTLKHMTATFTGPCQSAGYHPEIRPSKMHQQESLMVRSTSQLWINYVWQSWWHMEVGIHKTEARNQPCSWTPSMTMAIISWTHQSGGHCQKPKVQGTRQELKMVNPESTLGFGTQRQLAISNVTKK